MKKSDRIKVWNKYDKHCAYCGKIIKYQDMQVDHMIPKRRHGPDTPDNLMPACRRCNHYKRAWPLKEFRRLLVTMSDRIQKMYLMKVAIDYGIIKPVPWDGVFYFEKCHTNSPQDSAG